MIWPDRDMLDIPSNRLNCLMDKKEINSPKLTENFLFWICGVGGVILIALLGHFVWKIF